MFEKATKKLVEQTDSKGALIAVSSLNDSRKIQPLAVVQKIQKGWFWQQTKYKPTEFKLNDLLEGHPIKPVCEKEEFVKFKGEYKNSIAGSVEVAGSAICINANGQGTSNLSLSLGTLKKEAVNIPSLVKLTEGRKLNLTGSFFKKSSSKNKTLTLVKERIVTSSHCSICYTERNKASCHADIGCPEICMKDSCKVQHGSKTTCDIPPDTVMAYSVIEMAFEREGYFEWIVGLNGVESDDISANSFANFSEVDGPGPLVQQGSPLTTLKKALADVQATFSALTDLSVESRSSILLLLRKIVKERCALSALVDHLEVLSSGEAPCSLTSELSEEQSLNISAFLDLLKCDQPDKMPSTPLSSYNGCQISTTTRGDPTLASKLNGSSSTAEGQKGCHTAVSRQNGCSAKASTQHTELTYAMQMLINALQELMDDGLELLEPFCTSEGLQSLQDLVINLTTSDNPLCSDTIPVFLQSDFHSVEELFQSCNVSLRTENDTLSSEVTCREGFLPMVLCIAIHGLACFVAA